MKRCNCRTRVMKVKGTGSVVRAIQELLLIDYFTHSHTICTIESPAYI